MKTTTRYETKYLLSNRDFYQVRNELIGSHMDADIYSRESAYVVRSLYFDSDDFQAYHDKINGDWGRVKLRIRSYSQFPTDPVSVELKTRMGDLTVKHSAHIPLAWYERFMETKQFPPNDNPVLIEFERQVRLNHLSPKVLVQYERHGFRSRASKDLRVTFDHDVRSVSAQELFPERCFFRQHMRGSVVLEVKRLERQPRWVHAMVQKHKLRWIANSKYAQGIEISRPEVIFPASDPFTRPAYKGAAPSRRRPTLQIGGDMR